MEQADLRSWERQCTQDDMPKCRAACPLQMDVRPFLERMAHGDTPGARKVLERHLPLPGVLGRICEHPCETACVRQELGGPLAVGALERVCVSQCAQQTRNLPRPPKSKKVAVIGDGMAGLVAAWDLSRKAYPVDLFYAGGRPAEGLIAAFPVLTPEALDGELEAMRKSGVTLIRREPDKALFQEVEGYDAVFVDVSCAPGLAPASRDAVDSVTLNVAGGPEHVCFGGWPSPDGTGTPVAWAAEGRRAAMTLERSMTGVSLTASRENEGASATRLHTPLDGLAPLQRLEPEHPGEGYSLEEAKTEAGRCLQCECLICVRECLYMQKYKGYPRVYARQMYNNAAIVKGHHQANTMINSCTLCGQCEVLCPEGFSMADLCLSFREEMVRRGMRPPSAHEFALEDMAAANGPECALAFVGSGADGKAVERCGHVFFPGCQLAGARGEQVLAVYETLRKDLGSVGLLLQCCGVPAQWAGEEKLFTETVEALKSTWESLGRPRVIAACASCCKTLREALPEVSVVSLWEVLDTECPSLSFREEACCGGVPTLSIHDPCSARHDEAWLRSVRSLLSKRGVPFEEPRLSGETTPCCGYGGLTWDANPQLASAIAADRAGQLEHDAVTSCIMCRERLVAEGKPSLHMLDLLYPGESLHAAATAKGSGLSARRAGRAALRTEVLRRYAGESVAETADDGIPVRIAPDVLEKMEERHILREDAVRVVRHAEASGDTFLNRDNGHFLASLRPVRVTFWVEYSVEDGVCVVHDAYCHRMEVPGTSTPKGRYEAVRNPFHL